MMNLFFIFLISLLKVGQSYYTDGPVASNIQPYAEHDVAIGQSLSNNY